MSLNHKHKLQLLKDLLQNQVDEQHMTQDEAEQIDRLISTLSTDPAVQPHIQQMIEEIQHTLKRYTAPFPQKTVEQWVYLISLE